MCFSRKEKFEVDQEYGWKVFEMIGRKLYPEYRTSDRPEAYPLNTWIPRSTYILNRKKWLIASTVSCSRYRNGFHVFMSKRAAQIWIAGPSLRNTNNLRVRKVRIGKVLDTGYQNGLKVFTTDKIQIVSN